MKKGGKRIIPCLLGLAAVGLLITSCGSSNTWTRGVNLNYVLLIGQIDHNDSAARTAGIREALGTRDMDNATTNANNEDPIQGTLELDNGVTLTVNEVEHGEQRNTSGTAWDATTAGNSVATWLASHANDTWVDEDGTNSRTAQGINIVVSNNDGMAMAALNANGWVEGTPVFGYDANQDTLENIRDGGDIKGTISQNAPTQAASILMLTRNILDGVENPTEVGFSSSDPNETFGYVTQTTNYNSEEKAMLADNVAVDSPEDAESWLGTASQLVSTWEPNIKDGSSSVTQYNVFLNSYSNSDTFLISSMEPIFETLLPMFGLTSSSDNGYTVMGDGSSDSTVIDNITQTYDAYILNPVTTTAAINYLNKIADVEGYSDGDDPITKPVIFWNRQPTDAENNVDTDVMNDERFANIYYVGFDATQGGEAQGQMIVDYINENYDTLWDLTK